MGRKLKAKFKSNNGQPKKILRKRRIRKKPTYEKLKCQHMENGKQCTRNAVGKGDLCEKHGGQRIVSEDLVKYSETEGAVLKQTKFNPIIHPMQFIKHSKEGMSDVEIAAEFEVGVMTLRKWSETFEEFALAYEVGQALFEAWWFRAGRCNLDNARYNTSLYKFLTGNKLGWSDKIESKSTNMNLTGVLVVPGTKTQEQWEADAARTIAGDIIDAEVCDG